MINRVCFTPLNREEIADAINRKHGDASEAGRIKEIILFQKALCLLGPLKESSVARMIPQIRTMAMMQALGVPEM